MQLIACTSISSVYLLTLEVGNPLTKMFPCWDPRWAESTEDESYNLFIMGKDKKEKKPTQDDTSDAEITDNGDNITNDTTTPHFPRFLLIESIEENHNITSLSPFVIQKSYFRNCW